MEPSFLAAGLRLHPITADNLNSFQNILDHTPFYHNAILQKSPAGLASQCFNAPPPAVANSRVFRHLLLIDDEQTTANAAAIDIFAGFPNYKTASVALFVVCENCQRKTIASRMLTRTLPGFLREFHPAIQTIAISLTENNVPAMRCLLKCQYERTNRWEKFDVNGNPVIAVTFKKNIADLAP